MSDVLTIPVVRPSLPALERARDRALDLSIACDDLRADLARLEEHDADPDAIRETCSRLRELHQAAIAAQWALRIMVGRLGAPTA